MSLWELINPSDKITFKAPTHELAAIAVGIMGGQYGAEELDTETEPRKVPLFLFGGTEEFFQKTFGKTVGESFEQCDKEALAEVFESFLIGSMAERRAYEKALSVLPEEEKAAFKADWLDKERSSMNNICARAEHYARALRAPAKEQADGE